jgi:hypothetical protein
VREVGGFNAKYPYCMDVDMIWRVAEREPTPKYVDVVLGGLCRPGESKWGAIS